MGVIFSRLFWMPTINILFSACLRKKEVKIWNFRPAESSSGAWGKRIYETCDDVIKSVIVIVAVTVKNFVKTLGATCSPSRRVC